MFPKVLILTLLIFGTFAKDSNENVEERIEALERKLATLTMTNEMDGGQCVDSFTVSVNYLFYFKIVHTIHIQ